MDNRRKKQIFGILLLAFSLMFFISLLGHSTGDDLQILSDEAVYGNPFSLDYTNPGGMMGAYLSYETLSLLGWGAFPVVLFLVVLSFRIIGFDIGRRLLKHAAMVWALGFLTLLVFDISKVTGERIYIAEIPNGAGALGKTLIELSIKLVGVPGSYVLSLAAIICILVFYFSISHRFRNAVTAAASSAGTILKKGFESTRPLFNGFKECMNTGRLASVMRPHFRDELKWVLRKSGAKEKPRNESRGLEEESGKLPEDKIIYEKTGSTDSPKIKRKVVLPGKSEPDSAAAAETNFMRGEEELTKSFVMPGQEIFSEHGVIRRPCDEKELSETAQALRDTLETFGVRIDGNIEIFPGPVITRFEMKPAAGIKVNQVANLSDDLALNLRARSIRIVAPVPGKAAVGIEIPNRNPEIVHLWDIIHSDQFRNNSYELPLALGKDSTGNPYVTGLGRMPHLLIAGTTGSGKSVCINVIITSLVYSLHPDHLRFIFVDPKMLELTVYKGVPHLDEDVVTNAKQAERVLGNAVSEMELRYRKLAAAAVRNIVDYNRKQESKSDILPYIVIIIDELADLMVSTYSSRVELLITRLAQMARAVGIHLILATQRPSVDVITGLIKANFPSRIAFQVATKIDSRTVLDCNGAERLLGNGDMLILEAGSAEPVRLHGAFISSGDTERLAIFLKDQPYSRMKADETRAAIDEKAQLRPFNDPVLLEAIETVVRQKQASVSLLQRKLGIGYQRAARLIDELEEMKIIGQYNESKAREVLVDRSFLESIKNGKFSKT
jgi:S-DNA-T family DNA segregation ATPase FtsK/SpoIIIE